MAVDQRAGVGLGQPLRCRSVVDIAPMLRAKAGLVCSAGVSHGPGLALAVCQWQRQELLLPAGAAHLGAELLVSLVGQAQRIAVAEQPALAPAAQQRGVGQALHTGFGQQTVADQKVPVARHEGQHFSGAGLAQHADAFGLETLVARVVADPDLEQVAQQQHGVGGRAQQMVAPGLEGARHVGVQVHVRQQVDALPAEVGLPGLSLGLSAAHRKGLRRLRLPSGSPRRRWARRRDRLCGRWPRARSGQPRPCH